MPNFSKSNIISILIKGTFINKLVIIINVRSSLSFDY